MKDIITVTGIVGTTPRSHTTTDGLTILSFRLASTHRVYQEDTGAWVDSDTNWYTVTAFRQLAINCESSLEKGNRVVVSGTLRLKEWHKPRSNGDGLESGTNIEIEAQTIGHDLNWGTAKFEKVLRTFVMKDTEELQTA